MSEKEIKEDLEKQFSNLEKHEIEALVRSKLAILNPNKPELIKVDLGPYASRLYKYDLFNDEEYRLDSRKGLKFLHFNIARQGADQKTFSKRQFHVWQSRTAAVLALSQSGIVNIAKSFFNLVPDSKLMIKMIVGVTFLSRDDNYDRQIGRDESVKKMHEIEIEVNQVILNKTHIFIKLAPYDGISFNLRLNRKTGFSTVTGELTGREEDRK